METKTIRCRKCRNDLKIGSCIDTRCMQPTDSVLYIMSEDIPDWILSQVNVVNWTKGKLSCKKCGGRLGSFDFTNIKQCQWCREHDLSAIHIQQNRVDVMVPLLNSKEYMPRLSATQTDTRISPNTEETERSADSASLLSYPNTSRTMAIISDSVQTANTAGTHQLDNNLNVNCKEDHSIVETNRQFIDSGLPQSAKFSDVRGPHRQSQLHSKQRPAATALSHKETKNENITPNSSCTRSDSAYSTDCESPSRLNEISALFGERDADSRRVLDDEQNPFAVLAELHEQKPRKKELREEDRGRKNDGPNKVQEDTQPFLVETDLEADIPDAFYCAICYELYYRPHRCFPCKHLFCEPCLRQLARMKPSYTPCPMCRDIIMRCEFEQDLDLRLQEEYAVLYKNRRHNFRKIDSKFYKLPSCSQSQYNRNLHNGRRRGPNANVICLWLTYLVLVLSVIVISSVLTYFLVTYIYSLIISLDSHVYDWSQESNNHEHGQFYMYNILKVAIHACSWYNLYYQAMHFVRWYHYLVFLLHIVSVIQINLLRCMLYTFTAELVSRCIVNRRQANVRQRRR